MTDYITTTITVPFILRCNDVPNWNILDCCDSCHYDATNFGIEACTLYVFGKPVPVCCTCKGLTKDT